MAKDFRFERLKEYVDFLADSELSVEHLARESFATVYQRSLGVLEEVKVASMEKMDTKELYKP